MRPRRPVPADFAATVSRLKKGKPIRRHYRCNDLTFARWMQESGLALPDLDAMPSLFGAVHRLALAQSPDSPGGSHIIHTELLDMLPELRAAQAALNSLIVRAERLAA